VNDPESDEAVKGMFPTLITIGSRVRDGKPDVTDCGLVFPPSDRKRAEALSRVRRIGRQAQGVLR
jgi:hypothetical protein